MGEALISGAGGGAGSKIYRWKRYNVNSTLNYRWNRWNLVTTTTYKWNKYSATANGYEETVTPYVTTVTGTTDSGGSTYDCYIPAVSVKGKYSMSSSGWYYSGKSGLRYEREGWFCLNYHGSQKEVGYDCSNYCYMHSVGLLQLDKIVSIKEPTYDNNNHNYNRNGSVTFSTKNKYGVAIKYIKGSELLDTVTSTSSSAYPSNGASGSYWYESAGSTTSYSKGSTSQGYVYSTNSSAYPNGGYSGSYWYDNRYSWWSYSCGSYIDEVYAIDPNKYPQNAQSGSYWYIYSGEAN